MELSQIRYFVRAAKLGSITRAATEQGIAQPSLSKSIASLETEMGVRLFDRKGRGVRLNAAGRAFLRHAETALTALEDGRREVSDVVAARQEELSVAAVGLSWASDLFRAFVARYPEVRLRLYQRTPEEMVRGMTRREIDLCLVTDPRVPTIAWRPLVTGDVWVMVPPSHRLAGRGTVRLPELRGEPTILPRAGGPLREVVEALYRDAGMDLNVVCESDDIHAMNGLVRAGMGLQFAPDLRHAYAREADPLYLRLVEPKRSVEVGLAWPREGYHTRAAERFAAFAEEFFRSPMR